MNIRRVLIPSGLAAALLIAGASPAAAQTPATEGSPFVLDFGVGLDTSINGNVNSGAIGRLNGEAAAILPNPYGSVYGTGIQLKFGAGYTFDESSELRGIFTYQSADADLVRLGDLGPSNLYAQYSDYKALSLDLGYRRYVPTENQNLRAFGEATVGLAFIDSIDALLAAPQSDIVFNDTDFYDRTAAFTWSLSGGVVYGLTDRLDLTGQVGLRHVSGLAEVDQLVGTGLEAINNDSGRLTFPVVIGVRVKFP